MVNVFNTTKQYLNKEIDNEVYKKSLQSYCEIIDENRSGIDSLSFFSSAMEEIDNIGSFEDENNLRNMALLCDIFNNLAHSLRASKMKNLSGKSLLSNMFGMKKSMVFNIIKECDRINNKSYGLVSNPEQRENMFVVDVPEVGQLKWHFPKHLNINCQRYPHKIVDTKMGVTNKELIFQEMTISQVKKLSEHNQIVISSLDVGEMNDRLGLTSPMLADLKSGVEKKTQNQEELSQLNSRKVIQEKTQEL